MDRPLPCSFAQTLGAFASGIETPREFLDACIDEIEEREGDVQAFTFLQLDAARAAADASTQRWEEGAPLSAIDGMPIGVKDVIETADMPTQMGSGLFEGWSPGFDSASVHALREAGAIIVGKTVTTEFAATRPGPTRNPYDLARTPGGSSSGSAAAVGCGMLSGGLGTQVVGSIIRPASYCGVVGFKPSLGGINRGGSHDYMSQSCQGVLAATLEDAWEMAIEIVTRAGGDPGYPGLVGPAVAPDAVKPETLAFLETPGLEIATPAARAALEEAFENLRRAGVTIVTRRDSKALAALEDALHETLPLTRQINAWESRWPLNTYVDRDVSKLSKGMVDRLHEAEAMNVEDYRARLMRRDEIRALFAALRHEAAACITLSAPDVAPVGIEATGNPIFAVQASLLGVPALTLPVAMLGGLPLGLQAIGYLNEDAALFSTAAFVQGAVGNIAIDQEKA
jgi:Asp-tRNA(Asn)/Glu-tRNA(Gln) amidotransferase A subunit family amidase